MKRHLSLVTLCAALVGSAILPTPGWAAQDDSRCGRVFVANTQNELLRLRRTADYFEEIGERERRSGKVQVRATIPIAGLAAGEALVGIDFRPSTGVLYGVGRIGNDAVGQLYTIDVTDGIATPVGMRAIPLNGVGFGVDFNPVPDLLRIVSDAGQNIRVRPADGTVAGVDTMLAYPAMGDPNAGRAPQVVAVAYTNPDTSALTSTVLHDIDVNRAGDPGGSSDVLAIQVPPNGGVLNTVGRVGVDADEFTAFDIGFDNEALLTARPAGSQFSRLYFVDLPSGEAVDLGRIGNGELIVGLAIEVGPQCSR
jgi:hypothetical protein